jgi:hypothetical protein
MSRDLGVLETVTHVAASARHVHFHPEKMLALVPRWDTEARPLTWDHPCHYSDGTEVTARYVFVLDVLNHCFWPDMGKPAWGVLYNGEYYSGYWGLAASLKRAIENSVPITDPFFLSRISADELERVFEGVGEIPLFGERLKNLREAGQVLIRDWGGDVVHLIQSAKNEARRLVDHVVFSFSSFRDETTYKGKTVRFWKRAQIFAYDLHLAFSGGGLGNFTDIEDLTAFADYKLPQVLRHLGVISYESELARRIDRMEWLQPGCEEEVEIRAMTILAVEEIKRALASRGIKVSSAQVDAWLWTLGQSDEFRQKPYHRCRTIFY